MDEEKRTDAAAERVNGFKNEAGRYYFPAGPQNLVLKKR